MVTITPTRACGKRGKPHALVENVENLTRLWKTWKTSRACGKRGKSYALVENVENAEKLSHIIVRRDSGALGNAAWKTRWCLSIFLNISLFNTFCLSFFSNISL